MDSYYKLRQLFYYKVRDDLLQIATGITKCDGFITNYDRYYKVRWLLQIAKVHTWYINKWLVECQCFVPQRFFGRIEDAPILFKTTFRVKWVNLLRNCSFSILLILIDIGALQEETKWNSLVQYTSERSNRLWKTTTSVESSLWNSVVMLRDRGDLQSRFLLF